MITPQDIQKKALRHYKAFLTAVLTRTPFFPLHIKGNKGKANQPMDILFPALKRLLEGAKNKKGYGYTVTLKAVQTRHAGEISMPDDIYFENVEDYVKFIEKEQEFLAFRKVAMQSQKLLPAVLPWMQENPLKVIKHLAHWQHILKVGQYFLDNPQPKMYARALPLDIPTTFIENQTTILTDILTAILPVEAINPQANQFEKRFGLSYSEPIIRMRTLDEAVFVDWSMQDISLPTSTWQAQSPKVKTIFICTDLLNFLRFPNHPESLIIFGNTVTLKVLGELAWLAEKTIYLWTDIAINHFQVLADLRQPFSKIQPFLLDKTTFEKHQNFATASAKENKMMIKGLTQDEQQFLLYLSNLEGKNTLLQKHISHIYLKKKLKQL
ncbi:MAG: DUF3322 domain-containing protein [Saprospiraceae bacterium]